MNPPLLPPKINTLAGNSSKITHSIPRRATKNGSPDVFVDG
jgi:hypothetical protein